MKSNRSNTISQAVLFLVLSTGLIAFLQAPAKTAVQNDPKFLITIPQASFDLSDLDVRDAQNRKVTSVSAQQEMRRLFITGLHDLLMMNFTPRVRFMAALMNQSWDLFSGWIKTTVLAGMERIQAFLRSKKSLLTGAHHISFLTSAPRPSLQLALFSSRASFQSLISSTISSTQILR